MTNFFEQAENDAIVTAEYFLDEIVNSLIEHGNASDDLLNDYKDGDAYHHTHHTDKIYSLTEADELLEQLNEYEETDSGLWAMMSPREAIVCQATYTYANAVMYFWEQLIDKINTDPILADLLKDKTEGDPEADTATITKQVCEVINDR